MTDLGSGGLRDLADDAEDLKNRLTSAQRELESGEPVDRAVATTTDDIADVARHLAPVDEGDLVQSIHVEHVDNGVYEVVVDDEAAKPQEYGAGPHLIEADEADALHFYVDGKEMFRQSVNHPGNEPQPFIRPSLKAHERALAEAILDEIRDTIERHL